MIVYNVDRRFFAKKEDAERYRITKSLPPSATIKLVVNDRDQLSALLNGLCSASGVRVLNPAKGVHLVKASVPDDLDIPAFLRRCWASRGHCVDDGEPMR